VSIAEATGEDLDRVREELLVSERRKQHRNAETAQEDFSLKSSSSSKSNAAAELKSESESVSDDDSAILVPISQIVQK
jgi:hypothetical protein